MTLIRDYIHQFAPLWDESGLCRIRIYNDENAATIIVCTELPHNPSGSIVTLAEWLAMEIWEQEGKPDKFVWIEHYPTNVAPEERETFHKITFAHPAGSRFFSPRWESLTKEEVENLVHESVG